MDHFVKASHNRGRNWTEKEVETFAHLLCDEKYNFAISLERLAANKSPNNDVFNYVRIELDRLLQDHKEFPFTMAEPLNTSVEKIRRKYNSLKAEWRKIYLKILNADNPSEVKTPKWYHILSRVFISTNNEFVNVTAAPEKGQILWGNVNNQEALEDEEDEEICEYNETKNQPNLNEAPTVSSNNDSLANSLQVRTDSGGNTHSRNTKRKNIFAENKAVTKMAKTVETIASSQIKLTKTLVRMEKSSNELFYQHIEREAERQRAHELKLFEIFTNAMFNKENSPTFLSRAQNEKNDQRNLTNSNSQSKSFENLNNSTNQDDHNQNSENI